MSGINPDRIDSMNSQRVRISKSPPFAIRANWITLPLLYLLSLSLFPNPLEGNGFRIDRDELNHMQREAWLTIDGFQRHHYNRQSIYNLDPEDLIVSYMEELDYNRLFFLVEDKEEFFLTYNLTLIDVYLRQGQLHPAFRIFKLYRQRATERLQWVFERLDGTFDFENEDTFSPDRSEMEWPATKVEADEIWERRLTFDLLQELLNDETYERAREKVVRRYRRMLRYLLELDPRNVQELFLKAFARMFDPHSSYLSAESHDDFSITMRNSLVGIGALLRDEDGYCVIQELITGGPAQRSNQLHPGDKIIEVGQGNEEPLDVIDMKLRKIVEKIRGNKGTKVCLTIIPASATDPSARRVVSLIRDEIKLTEKLASAEIYQVSVGNELTVPIGVINLSSFYGSGVGGMSELSTTRDVEELIRKLRQIGIEGLVLNLSQNGGGLLSEATELTGLFIRKGPVVQVRDTTGQIRRDWDNNHKVAYDGPLAVLVSRRSASASEIVAGALQNHRRAVIVGDSATHGKGTVQAVFELDRSSNSNRFLKRVKGKFGAAKITVQKFYLPNGFSTQSKGVRSDVPIPSINDFLPIGESDLPNALVWDAIDALDWNPQDTLVSNGVHIDGNLLDYLREMSGKRVEDLEEFAYLQRSINWFKEKQDIKEYSLNLEGRRLQRDSDDRLIEEMDQLRELLSDKRFDRTEILLDVSLDRKREHQEKLHSTLLPNGRPRANAYYQKVFYYQPTEKGDIEEIWVENFNYEKILKRSGEVAEHLSESTGVELGEEAVSKILRYLKTAETSDEYNVEYAFKENLGDKLGDAAMERLIPEFFTKLIDIYPQILEERRPLNIPLRESLRIVADWILYQENNSQQSIAATRMKRAG